ncbi:MAG: bla [Massilia sp.]|nr:bla [Massilia sp.]
MTMIRLALACAMLAGTATPVLADGWDAPQEPFAIYGNTYYVGPHGVSSVLITSPQGHILIDGGSPESPKAIAAHIGQLGFKIKDVKYILNSHEHYDHAGGIAELQKWSGATVLTGRAGATVLSTGRTNPADPQFTNLPPTMAPVAKVRALADNEVVSLGPLRVTAHYTPGHTQGGMSWTWQSAEGGKVANMVYADSLTAYANKPFRYSGSPSWPQARAELERSIELVASLPCDIVISAHPEYSGLWERKAAADMQGHAGFIDTAGCRNYAAKGQAGLAEVVEEESASK